MTLNRTAVAVLLLLACGCASTESARRAGPPMLDDVSGLNATSVREVIRITDEARIVTALKRAQAEGLKISLAGRRHSQGGQAFDHDALVLDLTGFRRVLAVDPVRRTIRVQSGATWRDVQEAADAHGLAVKVMQSSNIFTVGGSLSVNVHGRDPNYGPIIETVVSFRLLQPDGTIVTVSRTENAELFRLAIGGYGLFGVILDVELSLTENVVLRKRTALLDYRDYPRFFAEQVRGRREVGLHYARLSNAAGSYLREMYATSFTLDTAPPERREDVMRLSDDEAVAIPRFFLGLARQWEWGKRLGWYLQKKVVDPPGEGGWHSRNNAMRPPVAFLEYESEHDTDILQEYFVPPEKFAAFVDGMREILARRRANLLNVTVRYVPENREAVMSYSDRESFALVLYVNQRRTADGIAEAEQWTRELIDLAFALGGTYYLPYQRYPTREQFQRSYPAADAFFQSKRRRDPGERFSSRFYRHYGTSRISATSR